MEKICPGRALVELITVLYYGQKKLMRMVFCSFLAAP